jgi:hypothetical protein
MGYGPIAAVVDWDALLEVVLVSLAGGVGLTALFSIAVAGAVSSVDLRRDGRPVEAGALAAVALAAIVTCMIALVYGIGLMLGG